MRFARCLILVALAKIAGAQTPRASDWLSAGGDAQHSGWEKSDSEFAKSSVKDFKPVLRRKLGSGETLHAPIVIGRLITHKGFKELAIVASHSGHIWAIDADLDLIFWERQLPSGTRAGCGQVAMPTMMPAPETGPGRNALRPIFVVAADGMLYRLNPATGDDAGPPMKFLQADSNASDLSVAGGIVHTTTAEACGTSRASWSIDTASGKVERDAKPDEESKTATWNDTEDGTHWKFVAPVEKQGPLRAFKGESSVPAWTSTRAFLPTAPVGANGVVFALSDKALHGLDARTGVELYSSAENFPAVPSTTGLSIANGRVYFATADGTLWAFGTPIER